jgi:outer membrane lipoprotein SlyB
MKRVLSILLMILTLTFAAGPIASAQTTRYRRHRHSRTFWQKHRDKLTVAGTATTGAGIGALTGGKKGAAIGTAVGAGSGALYTYKIRKRHRRVRRY